jgi:hypothetical protein
MTRARRARADVSYIVALARTSCGPATGTPAGRALPQRIVDLTPRIDNLVIERALFLTAGASFNAAVSLASPMS